MVLIVGDGRLGYEQEAPYDAIHVGAAAPDIPQKVIIIISLKFASNSKELVLIFFIFPSCNQVN